MNLNANFLTNIGTVWAEKIALTTWIDYASPIENLNETQKIGLIYTSDYEFAASPSAWTTNLSSYNNSNIKSSNWMYMGLLEWTITQQTDNSKKAFRVDSSGSVHYDEAKGDIGCVRPVFYLNSDVARISGTGTKTDPIRLGV